MVRRTGRKARVVKRVERKANRKQNYRSSSAYAILKGQSWLASPSDGRCPLST